MLFTECLSSFRRKLEQTKTKENNFGQIKKKEGKITRSCKAEISKECAQKIFLFPTEEQNKTKNKSKKTTNKTQQGSKTTNQTKKARWFVISFHKQSEHRKQCSNGKKKFN